jgi:hypothetical protein
MNHSSSAREELMTKANLRHRTTTLSSQNNLKKEDMIEKLIKVKNKHKKGQR